MMDIGRLFKPASFGRFCSCVLSVGAIVACSSSSDGPSQEGSPGIVSPSTVTPRAARALTETNATRARLAEIRGFTETVRDPLSGKSNRRPLIAGGVASRFESVSKDGVRPVIEAKALGTARRAHVELPSRAAAPASLVDESSGVGVSFALVGAGDISIEVADGVALYRNALGPGGDIIHRPRLDGTEDFVVLPERPAEEEIRYRVDVSRVAGLRFVSTMLEMLDEKGTPRLRVAPPYVVDANGKRHTAAVDVTGCSYDRSPEPPWGRAVTAPGSESCDVRVSWSGTGAAYPVIVDPAWTTTGSMSETRAAPGAAFITGPPARVIVAGGSGAVGLGDLYDVASGTWAATGPANMLGSLTTTTVLPTGRILFTGNGVGQVYNPGTGLFTGAANSMPVSRLAHTATLLDSGKVLLAAGADINNTVFASSDLYDPATNSFTPTGSVGKARLWHAAAKLPGGKVLIVGGSDNVNGGLDTAELYDPVAGTFGPVAATMTKARWQPAAAALPSGKILIVGDNYGGPEPERGSAELYDPTAGTFTKTGSLHNPQQIATWVGAHTLTLLPNGRVLAVHQQAPEIYDPQSGTFLLTGPLSESRIGQAAALLAGGSVLIAGGETPPFGAYLASCDLFAQIEAGGSCANGLNAECESLICNGGVCCQGTCPDPCTTCQAGTGACLSVTGADDADSCTGVSTCNLLGTCTKKIGQACSAPSECASGFCADGFCCDAACNGPCQQCFKTPGTCSAVKNGDDVGTCSGTNTCDINGLCKKRPGQTCTAPGQCAGGFCVDGVCCSTACNAACQTCSAAGTCLPVTNKDDVPGCSGAQTCSAAGACKAAEGQPCSLPTDCASGFCADGVCCESSCTGSPCMACSATATGSVDGKCAPVKAGSDPHNDCDVQLADCSNNGDCDGAGGCQRYPSGTACDAARCGGSTSVVQAKTCDGSGCNGGGAIVQCLPGYTCAGGVCLSKCDTNADCTAPFTCNNNQCKLPLGSVCSSAGECIGAICSPDGVCCDAPCDGVCEGCKLTTTGVASGTCAPITAGTDPDDECPDETAPLCQRNGVCDGARKCQKYAAGTVCVSSTCASATSEFAADTCDGVDTCVDNGTKPCAAGYRCVGGTCVNSCPDDSVCATGYVCSSGKCLLANGAVCAGNSACASGFCVEGVCCNEACTGTCRACTAAKKGSGTNGVCANVASDTDPDNECTEDANYPNSCAADGQCDGNGACRTIAKSTVACGATQCVSGSVTGMLCNGTGSGISNCEQSTTGASCAPYNCLNGQCGETCQADADCATDSYCTSANTCAFKRNLGENCGAVKECKSGFCADSVCCDKACTGQCEACNEASNAGTCQATTGTPRAPRLGCVASTECGGTCNGTNTATCTYPDATVICTPGSCANGMATTASVCDSAGACTPSNQNGCGAYACGATACKTTCTGVSDCATGAWCQSGACVPQNGTGGAPNTGGAGGSSGVAGATGSGAMAGAGGTTGSGAAAGAGGAGPLGGGGASGAGASSGASGSGDPDAGANTGGSGKGFDEPFAPQDSGCGCRTARVADDRTGSLLVALGLGLSLVRRRRKAGSSFRPSVFL